jgi:PAS domain S-box-containing protein
MQQWLSQLTSPDFMPHGYCYLWDPAIVWLHVISDALTAVSYFCIPLAIVYFVRRRRDLPFHWVFWMFGVFITSCGMAHLMEVWNVWHATYLLSGVIKAFTAGISVVTAALLIPLVPKAVSLPSPAQLQAVNSDLEREIAERKQAEDMIRKLKDRLEERIVERTAQLQSANEALRESEERLASVIASAMDAIITVDEQQRILVFNKAAEKMFRCPAQEALGASLEQFIPQRFRASHTEHHHRFSEHKATHRVMGKLGELAALRRDGTEFPVEISISQAGSGAKKIFTAIVRDITERKQTEEAVRQSEERLHLALDSAKAGAWEWDLQTNKSVWSRQLWALYGIELDSGEPSYGLWLATIHPDDREMAARTVQQATTTGGELNLEYRTPERDGRTRWLMARGQPMRDDAGQPVRFAGIVLDITERKQAEAALRQSEERLQMVMENMVEGLVLSDLEGRLLYWNRVALELHGFSSSEDLRCPLLDLAHIFELSAQDGAVIPVGQWPMARVCRGDQLRDYPVRVRRRDVEWERVFSYSGTTFLDSTGKRVAFVTISDITERKRAEEIHERLAAIVESSDDAIISKTLNGTITAWNRGAEKVFGYSSSEAVGKPMLMLMPPEHVNEESDILARIRHGESVEHFETVRVCKDGKKIDISATISPIKDSSGAIVGASKIARDITARKQAEEKLAEQAEELSRQTEELVRSQQGLQTQTTLLQSVLDSIGEGLVVADAQGRFILWNPAAEKIVGLGAASLPSQEWTEHYGLYLPDTVTPLPPEQNPLARAIHGEASTAEMFVLNPELAEGVWIEANAHPLRDANGTPRGGVVAFRDITQRRADERKIRQLNEELEERVVQRTAQLQAANQELEAFTYSVSHDLRAPLRHIAGFSGILVEEFGSTLDPQARHYLQRIQDGTRKMGQLVDELLALARLGRQSPSLQVAGLNSLVEEVVFLLKPEYDGRDVEWKVARLPFVECDPTLIKQVFQNLLSNALKYSRPRSPAVIEVGHTEKDGEPVIFVRDNGVGFSMKYADKLFGVFQRLHRSEDFEGTGVGLALVHRIVHKHGGRIWAEAELDHGATFYFTLDGLAKNKISTQSALVGADS